MGVLELCSSISLLGKFSILQKDMLQFWNHIHIWQMSLQLNCGNACQIWTRYSIAHWYFDMTVKLGKQWNSRNWLSNPHPRTLVVYVMKPKGRISWKIAGTTQKPSHLRNQNNNVVVSREKHVLTAAESESTDRHVPLCLWKSFLECRTNVRWYYVDGSVQDCGNSSANAVHLHWSYCSFALSHL